MLWRRRKKSLRREISAIKASLHVDMDPIRRRHAGDYPNDAKFLNLDRWIPFHVRILRQLDLFDAPSLNVLDIGCGGGLFLYCLKHYGHRAFGLDIKNALFADMANALGVDRRIYRVQAFHKLRQSRDLRTLHYFRRKFDLITVIAPMFDRPNSIDRWGASEWCFFLTDVSRHLAYGGRFYIRLNRWLTDPVERAFTQGSIPSTIPGAERPREFIFDLAHIQTTKELLRASLERLAPSVISRVG